MEIRKVELKSQDNSVISCTARIAKHLTLTLTLTCFRLTLLYYPYFCIVLTIILVITKSLATALTTNVVAKQIVLSNKISVVLENVLRFYR